MGRFAGTDTISLTPGALKITWMPPRPGLRHSTKFSSATACTSSMRHPIGFLRIFGRALPSATITTTPHSVSLSYSTSREPAPPSAQKRGSSRCVQFGRPAWMGAPFLCGWEWPEINWIGSSGPLFRLQRIETCPDWGANSCIPSAPMVFWDTPHRGNARCRSASRRSPDRPKRRPLQDSRSSGVRVPQQWSAVN